MCPVVALLIFSGGWQVFHSLGLPETFWKECLILELLPGSILLPAMKSDYQFPRSLH